MSIFQNPEQSDERFLQKCASAKTFQQLDIVRELSGSSTREKSHENTRKQLDN